MSIEWRDGDVCFAAGTKWDSDNDFSDALNCKDFQLNTIKQGDFIEVSELDTEQNYNDVVEVFGLFGFDSNISYEKHIEYGTNFVVIENDEVDGVRKEKDYCQRKLTCQQIMAIGELKRMMNERDKPAPKTAPNLTPDAGNKTAKDYLNECIEVQNQRGEQYDSKGTGERSFAAAASAFNAMTGQNLKGSDVCLLLTCVKAVRQYSDTTRVHEDSLLDLVSYTSLWAEELNKELK